MLWGDISLLTCYWSFGVKRLGVGWFYRLKEHWTSVIVILHFLFFKAKHYYWRWMVCCPQLLTKAMCPACIIIIQALIYTEGLTQGPTHCWFPHEWCSSRKRGVFGYLSLSISIWSLFLQYMMFPLQDFTWFFALLELLQFLDDYMGKNWRRNWYIYNYCHLMLAWN